MGSASPGAASWRHKRCRRAPEHCCPPRPSLFLSHQRRSGRAARSPRAACAPRGCARRPWRTKPCSGASAGRGGGNARQEASGGGGTRQPAGGEAPLHCPQVAQAAPPATALLRATGFQANERRDHTLALLPLSAFEPSSIRAHLLQLRHHPRHPTRARSCSLLPVSRPPPPSLRTCSSCGTSAATSASRKFSRASPAAPVKARASACASQFLASISDDTLPDSSSTCSARRGGVDVARGAANGAPAARRRDASGASDGAIAEAPAECGARCCSRRAPAAPAAAAWPPGPPAPCPPTRACASTRRPAQCRRQGGQAHFGARGTVCVGRRGADRVLAPPRVALGVQFSAHLVLGLLQLGLAPVLAEQVLARVPVRAPRRGTGGGGVGRIKAGQTPTRLVCCRVPAHHGSTLLWLTRRRPPAPCTCWSASRSPAPVHDAHGAQASGVGARSSCCARRPQRRPHDDWRAREGLHLLELVELLALLLQLVLVVGQALLGRRQLGGHLRATNGTEANDGTSSSEAAHA